MVCPILISVSVTPGALSARAEPVLAAKAATALDCKNERRVNMLSLSLFISARRGPGVHCLRLIQVAELLPALSVERGEGLLADRTEIVGRSVDLDPRQSHRQHQILDVGGLPHHVLAR